MRECRYCGETKPLEEFNFSNRAKGIRQERCRACFSEYNRQRYLEKGDNIRAVVAAYRAANSETLAAKHREAYWRDVESSRARARASSAIQNAKPERKLAKREWTRQDRAKSPEKYREKNRRWCAANPQAAREKVRRHQARKLAATVVDLLVADIEAKWDFWNGQCWMCGRDACEWDHVRPLAADGLHCLANLRPACRNCNARKSDAWPFCTTPWQDPFGLAGVPLVDE